MYFCGAKFQEHCFHISRDIVYSAALICIIRNINISKTKKDISKRKFAILPYFEKPFEQAGIIFRVIYTLTKKTAFSAFLLAKFSLNVDEHGKYVF